MVKKFKQKIPFVVTRDGKIHEGADLDPENTYVHTEICQRNGVNEDRVLKFFYLLGSAGATPDTCVLGIDGTKFSRVYDDCDKPFEVKVSHLNVIESAMKRWEKQYTPFRKGKGVREERS